MRSLRTRVERKLRGTALRGHKYLRQRITGKAAARAPLFLLGCQRSGTNMMMQILDASLDTWTYNEDNPRAFSNYRLRDDDTLRSLVQRARGRWVVFKPLCDTQHMDRLMAAYPDAHVIWMYRNYKDVSNSAIRNWGDKQLEMIRNAATNPNWRHWLVERMHEQQRELVRSLYSEAMTNESAAALKWYLRNQILFESSHAQDHERVHIVKYEQLATKPLPICHRLFDQLGIEFTPEFSAHVSATSIEKNVFPAIAPAITDLCERLTLALDALAADAEKRARR